MIVKEYGYEYDASYDALLWEKTKGQVARDTLWGAICLRSGRDTLKVIAREHEPTTVLMPALSCDSMVLPFKMYGHTIVYYCLTDDYKINIQQLTELVPEKKALFLYMDYFGVSAIDDDGLNYLQQEYSNLIFVEDRTHNLIWKKERGFIADYTMASLRKWLNVPDGGLLWSKNPLIRNDYAEDTSFYSIRLKAQCMRREFLFTGDETTKSSYRKIFSSVSNIIDRDKQPSRMSAYSYQLAQKANWDEIRHIRQENAGMLISILKKANVNFIQPEAGHSDLYTAFKISNRNYKQGKPLPKGIFNTIIWPLSEEQKQACQVARTTDEMMLAAPCDQRYTVEDMKNIGYEMVRVFNE